MFASVKDVRERSNDRSAGVQGSRASRLCQKGKKQTVQQCILIRTQAVKLHNDLKYSLRVN